MLRKASLWFGIGFILAGVLGFVPGLTIIGDEGTPLLLGLFMVDTVHNWIHLVLGVLALVGSASERYARLYFQVFGVAYGLVCIIGFIQGDTVLGIIPVNLADNLLHLVIAATALYLGFGSRSSKHVAQV